MNINALIADALDRLKADPQKGVAILDSLISFFGPALAPVAASLLPTGALKDFAHEHPDQLLQGARDLLAFIAQHPELARAAAGQFGR